MLASFIVVLAIYGCNEVNQKTVLVAKEKTSSLADDKEQIQSLIRRVYKWHDKQKPSMNKMITDNKDSIYIGFNLHQLQLEIENLKATDFFLNEFIDNYNKIYRTLDKKLRSKEIEWLVGVLPPFGNNANPWCNCQDVPFDDPNPWDFIEIEIIHLDNEKGDLLWKWGGIEFANAESWNEFTYKFSVVKENGKWKISYLEGFNFDEFTREI